MGAIAWLEGLLKGFAGAVVFVTHDRAFMENVANRIWELDRGRLLDVKSDYRRFLQTREEILHAEAEAQARFDKKLAEEEKWIRQGIKARRTRNEGRVRALKAMRHERAARLERQGKATLRIDAGERSGVQVIVAEDIHFAYGDAPSLVNGFSDIVERGEKIGLVGANGVGKTTLLKVLLGQLAPQSGTLRHGTRLEVAYFDQLRATLDENATLRDSLGQGSDYVEVGGERKHVVSYLQDFLFPPERWQTPVSALSGGERARLLLARLFAQPANVLVLDEPTNDLDIETLELLEQLLQDYDGTLFLVSHDRTFLDNVVTQTIAAEGEGGWKEYAGGYSDWANYQASVASAAKEAADKVKAEAKPASKPLEPSKPKGDKLSWKEQRELEALPERIAALEAEQKQIQDALADGTLFATDNAKAVAMHQRDAEIDEALMEALERWTLLSE